MTSSVPPIQQSLHALNCCALLYRCELIEIAYRIQKVIVNTFSTLAQMIVYSVKWVLNCGRVSNDRLLTDNAAPQKLHGYKKLPIDSPAFERAALELASIWLTREELDDIKSLMDFPLLSQIVVRAAMLAGRAPVYTKTPYFQPRNELELSVDCELLHTQFKALPALDKIAILDHLDSEIFTFEESGETKYQLRSPPDKKGRPFIPPPTIISQAAKDLWNSCRELATAGIRRNHPIMKGLSKM